MLFKNTNRFSNSENLRIIYNTGSNVHIELRINHYVLYCCFWHSFTQFNAFISDQL